MAELNGCKSDVIQLKSRIRQGGVLSPILFAVYVNNIILRLHNSGVGCHVSNVPMCVFMFADDLVLLSASIKDLQCLINLCLIELKELDVVINVNKSKCVRIGKRYKAVCVRLDIGFQEIMWHSSISYLGIHFEAFANLSVDLKNSRAKFYRTFNDIYSKVCRSSEIVILSFVKTFCLSSMLWFGDNWFKCY